MYPEYNKLIILGAIITLILFSLISCAQSGVHAAAKHKKLITIVDSVIESIESQDYRLLGNATIIDGTSGGRIFYNANAGFSKFLIGSYVCESIKTASTTGGNVQMSDICIVKNGNKKILSVLVYNTDVSILVSNSTYNEKLTEYNKDLKN